MAHENDPDPRAQSYLGRLGDSKVVELEIFDVWLIYYQERLWDLLMAKLWETSWIVFW